MKKLLFFFAYIFFGYISAQVPGASTEIDIRNNDDFEGFDMIDASVKNARLIMTGENHMYVKFNSKMELKMLRYLNKKLGLRNFIIELGEARAHFLNRYILNPKDTAATNYLRATTSPRYMDLFNRLRSYNMSLPDSLKIHVYGIDVERFNDLPLMRLAELLPVENIPSAIRVGVESVKGAAAYMVKVGLDEYEKARDESSTYHYEGYQTAPFYINPTITEFIRYYDSLNPIFRSWLGEKFDEVNQSVSWLKEYDQWNKYENTTFQYIWREENIYQHLAALMRKTNGERFYGQFGRCHVAYDEQNGECGWYGYHSVMNKMRTRYFHNYDSVLTIGLFYHGGIDNSRYYSDKDEHKDIQEEIDVLQEKAEVKKITLFSLNDEVADMPLLSKKFSFAIVNRSIDLEFEDTIENEVISGNTTLKKSFTRHNYMGYGYTLTSTSLSPLGDFIASNGYSTSLGNLAFHNILYGYSGDKLDASMQFSFMPRIKLHGGDSGLVEYGSREFLINVGYQVLKRPKLTASLGLVGGYAIEKIYVQNQTSNFLQPKGDKEFSHQALIGGVQGKMQYRFKSGVFIGLQGSIIADGSTMQWYYSKSIKTFGKSGEVTSGFGGYYALFSIGYSLDALDDISGDME
ncbi:MAG: hypothetical protein KG003_04135 [Bacteroidetes bacterium]|nr:hypothetical protein [Bacteroidota bacterium]